MTNRRFNYQAKDSPEDLLARDKRMGYWCGRFAGPMYLAYPRIAGLPRELRIAIICSWGPGFALVEFKWGGKPAINFPVGPTRGVSTWARAGFPMNRAGDSRREESQVANRELASSTQHPPPTAAPSSEAPTKRVVAITFLRGSDSVKITTGVINWGG